MRIKDLRVGHVDMNFVLSVLFILPLCFKNELLQDVVITCDDATGCRVMSTRDAVGGWGGREARTHLIFNSEECP